VSSAATHPRIRPIEVFPAEQEGQSVLVIHDPSGLATGSIVVSSSAVVFIFSLFDGDHSLEGIQRLFREQFSCDLPTEQIESMVAQLEEAHFLESEEFASYLQGLIDEYHASPLRVSAEMESDETQSDGLASVIRGMLGPVPTMPASVSDPRLAGLVVPHLDYPRGGPCYAKGYGRLAALDRPARFVILGTNHFGRATSVVATGKDFQTALGITGTDRDFIDALSQRCNYNLCEDEFDHLREHSVESQVMILQHLFGPANFQIVPVLCHDPCGPQGTAPYDGNGVDLRVFAETLGTLIREDDTPTVVIAGADLSHVGRRFGDDRDIDDDFLCHVEINDREALDAVVGGKRDEFVEVLKRRQNSTRVCSAGCIYALMTALPDTRPELLNYHQAADRSSDTCVTCSAVAFWE